MSTWYYTRGGTAQQEGPVTAQALKDLAMSGQLAPADSVWKDGMTEWVAAARIKGLFPEPADAGHAAAAHAPLVTHAAQPQVMAQQQYQASPAHHGAYPAGPAALPGQQIGYFSPAGGVPDHYRAGIARFGSVTGNTGEWPLSPQQMQVIKQAGSLRRLMRGMSIWFKMSGLFLLIGAIFMGFAMAVGGGFTPRGIFGAMGGRFGGVFAGILAFYLAFGILFYLCGAATASARMWGPIVMGILYSLFAVLILFGTFVNGNSTRLEPAMLIVLAIYVAVPVLLAILSFKAAANCPKFRALPQWAVAVFGEGKA